MIRTAGLAASLSFVVSGSASSQVATAIAAGGEGSPIYTAHTCALVHGGGILCWGANLYGQLGDGTTTNRRAPVAVSGLSTGVQAIAASAKHTCALTTAGGVKCWGLNNTGQLGDGTQVGRLTPVNVSGLTTGISAIVAGADHTCALTAAGVVKCWGLNNTGQLGDGTTSDRHAPVGVSGLLEGVQAIAAGKRHTCALMTSGGVKCWGANFQGQLGDGTTATNGYQRTPVDVSGLTSGVHAIVAGDAHTCALLAGGAVMCWGWNSYEQVGDGTTADRRTPVAVSGLASGVQAIAAGFGHTCALTTAGAVKCWGLNMYGELGDGTKSNRSIPVLSGLSSGVEAIAAGGEHTCALISDGGVKCWGSNVQGELGDVIVCTLACGSSAPMGVRGFLTGVQAIVAGGCETYKCIGGVSPAASGHTCALKDGGVKCWGGNGFGQLGDGTQRDQLTPVNVSGLASGIRSIAAGGAHTCALTISGGVKCWGNNGEGQIGDGTTGNIRLVPVAVDGLSSGVQAIAAGDEHTCALIGTGGIKCWGRNGAGDFLGTKRLPVDVAGLSGGGMQAITAGFGHTCGLTTPDGGVTCWGSNNAGQLGDGSVTTRHKATPVVGLSRGVRAIAAGSMHTCALTGDGDVKCWGANVGTLGDEHWEACYYSDLRCQTALIEVSGLSTRVEAVAAGGEHTCALTSVGGIKCWGSGSFGELGNDRNNCVGRSIYSGRTGCLNLAAVDVSTLSSGVLAITAGFGHTCALTPGGLVMCWGGNSDGRLGDGTTQERTRPVSVIGERLSFEPALAPDGSGTMSVSLDSVAVGSTGNTFSFTYTAARGGMANGTIKLDVPADWSAPSTNGTDPGFVQATLGTVTIDNTTVFASTVAVSGLTLSTGQTVTLTYGSKSVRGPGATAPATSGSPRQVWATVQQSNLRGRKTMLASPPSIVLVSEATTLGATGVKRPIKTPPTRDRRTITDATATILFSNLNQAYDGTAKSVSTATTPSGLTVNITYDGSPAAPKNAGNYAVVATVADVKYQGSAQDTLRISKAISSIAVRCPATPQPYTGGIQTPCTASATGVGMSPVDVTPRLIYLNNTNLGTATATATYAGDHSHTRSSNSSTFEITPPVAPAPLVVSEVPPRVAAGCSEGCFDATVTGAHNATLSGRAQVETSDGDRYRIVFRSALDEGHYLALTREQGGPAGPGMYRLGDTCGEGMFTAKQDMFQGEYFLNDYKEVEATIFRIKSGRLTIESADSGRLRGSFEAMACVADGEDKFKLATMKGTFDALDTR